MQIKTKLSITLAISTFTASGLPTPMVIDSSPLSAVTPSSPVVLSSPVVAQALHEIHERQFNLGNLLNPMNNNGMNNMGNMNNGNGMGMNNMNNGMGMNNGNGMGMNNMGNTNIPLTPQQASMLQNSNIPFINSGGTQTLNLGALNQGQLRQATSLGINVPPTLSGFNSMGASGTNIELVRMNGQSEQLTVGPGQINELMNNGLINNGVINVGPLNMRQRANLRRILGNIAF